MQTCLKKSGATQRQGAAAAAAAVGGARNVGWEAERTLSRRAECIKNSKCPTPSGQRLPAINAELCPTHTHTHSSLLSTILYGLSLYECVCVLVLVLLSVSATLLCTPFNSSFSHLSNESCFRVCVCVCRCRCECGRGMGERGLRISHGR